MDFPEARLDTIELQRSTHDTKPIPEYLANLRLSDLYNLPGESVAMTSEIFSAMRAGSRDFLVKMKSYETPMTCFKNSKGDSILHIAASFGHCELVKSIISECPSLLLEPNWKDRTPLHVAARAGCLVVVEVLAASIASFSAKLPEEDRERLNPYVIKDINGDTPLHLAMKDLEEKTELFMRQRTRNHRFLPHVIKHSPCSTISKYFFDVPRGIMETSVFLVHANQSVSHLANNDGISPLYLAVKAGNLSLVNAMLRDKSSNLASQLEGRKSLVQVALKAKNIDVLDVIISEYPSLVNEKFEGQTCISVGASIGFYEGVCKLLDQSTSSVFECDDDGSFPIHKAVEKGHVDVVKEILKRCPNSIEQLNKEEQNVLHIAAKSGKSLMFLIQYIKNLGTKKHLLEEQDVDGNTPLHLATIKWRPRSVDKLTRFFSRETSFLEIQNKDGLRPLDIAQIKLQPDYVFRERMTLMVLLCVYKPRGVSWVPTSGMTLRSRSDQVVGDEKFKDRINVLLLMAALVATMTFAAGFTIPGGFNGSAPNMGMAILVDDPILAAFLVCDTLAMQCSLVAIVALIWAQLGDRALAHKAFHLALPSLFFALLCMSMAFILGIQATIRKSKSLTRVITIIFQTLSSIMVFLLTPYMIPQLHGIPVLNYVTGLYLEHLLWFVNEDDADKLYLSDSGDPEPGFIALIKDRLL